MMDLVEDIERTNNAWAVGRFDLIASQAKLPEQIARQIPPVKWFAAAGHINGGVSAQIRAEANDDQAAENLRGVLNGVISLARLQGQKEPKLTSLIESFQMSGHRQDRPALVHHPGRDLRADGAEVRSRPLKVHAFRGLDGIRTAGGQSAGRFVFGAALPLFRRVTLSPARRG